MKETPISDKQLSEWTQASAFVFTGHVEALGSSNLDGVEPDAKMATVRVDQVAIAPADLGDLRDRVITVALATINDLAAGDQVTFFARTWQYGRSIGVVEIGRTSVPADVIRQDVLAGQLQQLEDQLVERIHGAEVILAGLVTATRPVARTPDLPGFEEGVQWWVADLWIGSVEKGQPPGDRRIWFPEGGDRYWGIVPKAHPRQEGVWLLRPLAEPHGKEDDERDKPDERQLRYSGAERRLMARQRLDFHAMSDLQRIRTLLRRISK
jgi:hypothetical protein